MGRKISLSVFFGQNVFFDGREARAEQERFFAAVRMTAKSKDEGQAGARGSRWRFAAILSFPGRGGCM